jgi:hypothetical protein
MFDAQILLDPFEKQFDSPALFIDRGDRCCRQHKIVIKNTKRLLVSGSQNETRRKC